MISFMFKSFQNLKIPYKDKNYLEILRAERLKKLVLHAKINVPFYKKKYASLNINKIKHINDIQQLPIIKSKELKQSETINIT